MIGLHRSRYYRIERNKADCIAIFSESKVSVEYYEQLFKYFGHVKLFE